MSNCNQIQALLCGVSILLACFLPSPADIHEMCLHVPGALLQRAKLEHRIKSGEFAS